MNGINATPGSPVFTPQSDHMVVTRDKTFVQQIGPQTLAQIAAGLPGTASAELPLAAPDPEALASVNVQAAARNFASLGASEVSFDIFTFRALCLKYNQEARNGARAERESQGQAQVNSIRAEAQEMRNAAQSKFNAAMVQGAMQIAGGVLQVGLSAASAAQSIKSVHQESAGNLAEGKLLTASAGMYQGFAQGSPGITSGLGGMIGAGFTLEADEAEARRTEQAIKTKVAETAVQHANELMQQAQEAINALKDMGKSLDQSNSDTNRRIASNI